MFSILFVGSALYPATGTSMASDTASHVSFKVLFGEVCVVRRFIRAACFVRRRVPRRSTFQFMLGVLFGDVFSAVVVFVVGVR